MTTTRPYGSTAKKILELLEDLGPMTAVELFRELNIGRRDASAVVTRLRRPTKTMPKRIYVTGWTEDAEGLRRYPRAILAIGDKPDKERSRAPRSIVRRRSEEGKRMRNTANSVFNLATSRKDFRI